MPLFASFWLECDLSLFRRVLIDRGRNTTIQPSFPAAVRVERYGPARRHHVKALPVHGPRIPLHCSLHLWAKHGLYPNETLATTPIPFGGTTADSADGTPVKHSDATDGKSRTGRDKDIVKISCPPPNRATRSMRESTSWRGRRRAVCGRELTAILRACGHRDGFPRGAEKTLDGCAHRGDWFQGRS